MNDGTGLALFLTVVVGGLLLAILCRPREERRKHPRRVGDTSLRKRK